MYQGRELWNTSFRTGEIPLPRGRQAKSQQPARKTLNSSHLFESFDFIKLSRPFKLFVLLVFVVGVEVEVASFKTVVVTVSRVLLLLLLSISLFISFNFLLIGLQINWD